jgi:CRP-like cAMP-binding protein
MDALTFLRERVELFSGVSEAHLEALAEVSTLGSYNNGQTIIFKGATGDGLHVVAVGKVGVFVKPPAQPLAMVAELGSGDVFGEMTLIEDNMAGATVKATSDGTFVLNIPQDAFKVLLSESPEFVVRVKALSASRKAPKSP